MDMVANLLSQNEKQLAANLENGGRISGNWLQLEPSVFKDLQTRNRIPKNLAFQQVVNNPELYDQVAGAYVWDTMQLHKIPTPEDVILWMYRPAYYNRYGKDIEKIPNTKKGSFGKSAKQVMRQRKQTYDVWKKGQQ